MAFEEPGGSACPPFAAAGGGGPGRGREPVKIKIKIGESWGIADADHVTGDARNGVGGAYRERLAGADRRHLDPSNVTSLTALYVYPPWAGHTLLVRNSQGPQGGLLVERHAPAVGVRHHRRRRQGCPRRRLASRVARRASRALRQRPAG